MRNDVRQDRFWETSRGERMFARSAAGPAGTPIVLVHGLGISSRYMIPLVERLSPFRAIHAPDFPGFGRSPSPAHILNVRELADALLAWLSAANIPTAILLGNSLGAQIAIEAAIRQPERVERLVLVGPTVDAAARSAPRQIMRLMLDALQEPWSLVGIAMTDYLRCGPWRLWRTLRYAIEDPVEQKLVQLACPTLIVRGTNDPLVPEAWAEEVARLVPHGELRVMPGTHALHYARPDLLLPHLTAFLQLDSATRASGSTDFSSPPLPESR